MSADSTDVIIVGAGACGSLVTKEGVANGCSVVGLEAGKRFTVSHFTNSETNGGIILRIADAARKGDL